MRSAPVMPPGQRRSLARFCYTDANDLISAVPVGSGKKEPINANAANSYVYGIEVEGAWHFHPRWTLSGFTAWQDGRTASPDLLNGPLTDKPMSRQLPLTGSVALRWTAPTAQFWVDGRVLATASEDRITAADQAADNQRIPLHGTPGYIVALVHAGWKVNEHLSQIHPCTGAG